MGKVLRQNCFNHPGRDAAARCPECGRFFCRECVAEHSGRVLCANCLTNETADEEVAPREKTRFVPFFLTLSQLVTGLFFLWMLFQFIGQLLLRISSEFHDGSVWSGIL